MFTIKEMTVKLQNGSIVTVNIQKDNSRPTIISTGPITAEEKHAILDKLEQFLEIAKQ